MRLAVFLPLAWLLLLAPAVRAGAPDPDELAIFRVIFRGIGTVVLPKPDPKAKPAAENPPGTEDEAKITSAFKEEFPGVEPGTIEGLIRSQANEPELTPKSDVGVKLKFVEEKKLEQILAHATAAGGVWAPLKKRFPGAEIALSYRFGFNPAKTQAFVQVFRSPAADPYLYLLEKRAGKWTVAGMTFQSGAW